MRANTQADIRQGCYAASSEPGPQPERHCSLHIAACIGDPQGPPNVTAALHAQPCSSRVLFTDWAAAAGGAVTGDIHPEDKHVLDGTLSHPLTLIVCVTNFFFVTIVLMNLLIAMLSQTYEEISRDARECWKLHRATILVKIDRAVGHEFRAGKVFWQTAPSETGARRPHSPHSAPLPIFKCFHSIVMNVS